MTEERFRTGSVDRGAREAEDGESPPLGPRSVADERLRTDELAAMHDALSERIGRPLGVGSFNPRCSRCRDARLPDVIVGKP